MKYFILITILFFNLSCSSQDFNITGKWTGSDKDKNIGSFLFHSNGFVTLEIQGRLFGGENFDFNGIESNLKYKIDYQKEPTELELTLTENNTNNIIQKFYFIVKTINENEIKIGINNEGFDKKPTDFTPENTLHFIRKN